MSSISLFTNQNLIAYMDETGSENFYGMAGFITTAANWEILTHDWKKILQEFGLKYFHMVDYNNGKKQFEGWKENKIKCETLLGKLVNAIKRINPIPVGALLSLNDYKSLTDEQRYNLSKPYDMCFQRCISRALYVTAIEHNNQYSGKETPVEFVFADKDKIKGRAEVVFNAFKTTYLGTRLHSMQILGARDYPPLQAADILAYELLKFHTYSLKQKKLRFAYEAFNTMAAGHKEYVWCDPFKKEELEKQAEQEALNAKK